MRYKATFVLGFAAGYTLGAKAGGFNWREAGAVGFGLNARGAMEIILALLALEAGLLKEQVFVALVVGSIELYQVVAPRVGLAGPAIDLSKLGYVLVATFVAAWVVSAIVWKTARIEQRFSPRR